MRLHRRRRHNRVFNDFFCRVKVINVRAVFIADVAGAVGFEDQRLRVNRQLVDAGVSRVGGGTGRFDSGVVGR